MRKRTLLNLDEVATYLQVSASDVRLLIEAEELHGIEILGAIRVHPADLQRFVRIRRGSFRPTGSAA
jgi:helix-turn-helix protein